MDTRTGLLLGRLEFLRSAEKVMVAERLERADDWSMVTPADLETWLGRPVRARWEWREIKGRWEADQRFLERPGVRWLRRGEAGFPAALAEIADPPWALWVRGEPLALDRSWVAIVGTRFPDETSKAAAWVLGRDLAAAGAVVVSGLARGIDGQAHRGALEGGVTVAVLGQGIDHVSPLSHRELARRIVQTGGAVVSEYGPGEPAFGYRFVQRNRIISGLSRTVVVVQAPARSGALLTADFALDQGRDVVVHRAGLCGERGEGTRHLVRQGATVIENCAELISMWWNGAVGTTGSQAEFDWGNE